jgi:hypothetical protein
MMESISPFNAVTLQIVRKKYAICISLALLVQDIGHNPPLGAKTSEEISLSVSRSPDSLCKANT